GNVPNLRFPEFSGEWEEYKLGDIADVIGGGTPETDKPNYWNGKYVWFTPTEIGKVKYVSGSMRTISELGLKNSSAKLLPIGTILLSTRATIGECSIALLECTTNQGFQSLIAKPNINNEFLYYLALTLKRELLTKANGSTFLEISASEIRNIRRAIPSIEEQKKTTSLLSLIDERIATQKKIIEELKVLKSAIAERLFSCRTSCAEYFYRDLFAISSKRNKDMARTNILSASQEFGMIERDKLNIDIKFNTESINTYKLVDDGDYIIHLRSFQGGLAFSAKSGICSPAYTILKPSHLLEYGFLKLYFTSKSFIKSLVLVTYGIRDGRSISVDEFLDLTVYMPTKDEQKIISTALNKWDNKIANEAKLLELLKDQKQYLLSQMFI
ncbi:MAG: restriction endonuclease subunit S, partial [Rikenellaceae bacterium]